MIHRNIDFDDKPPNSPLVLASQLTQPQAQNGLPDGVKLSNEGMRFLVPSDSEYENTRTYRQAVAEKLIPVVEHHCEQLEIARQINEREKAKYPVRDSQLRFNHDVVFKPIAIPLLIAIAVLSLFLVLVGSFEITTAVAGIRAGSMLESQPSDPRLPAIEPTFSACMGLAIIPIVGLFTVLEFISFSFQKKRPRKFVYFLVVIGLPLAMGCTWLFAFMIGTGTASPLEIGASFQADAPPSYFFGMTMTALSFVCAMVMHGIKWLASHFFVFAPRSSQFSCELEDAGNHLLECIKTTAETLSVLYAVGSINKQSKRRHELQTELSSLN